MVVVKWSVCSTSTPTIRVRRCTPSYTDKILLRLLLASSFTDKTWSQNCHNFPASFTDKTWSRNCYNFPASFSNFSQWLTLNKYLAWFYNRGMRGRGEIVTVSRPFFVTETCKNWSRKYSVSVGRSPRVQIPLKSIFCQNENTPLTDRGWPIKTSAQIKSPNALQRSKLKF